MSDSPFLSPCALGEAGIAERTMLRFLDVLAERRLCMHSMLVVRSGRIAFEAYWEPYDKNRFHRMYSITKSFVSIAVGLLESEGKLSLCDPVVKYFPEKVPNHAHPYLLAARIRDLLSMSSVHDDTTYSGPGDKNWIDTWFETPPSHLPGAVFHYDTSATTVLCALVEKLTGGTLLDYLRPRLLDPIGFSKDAWCIRTPCGSSWGGSGLLCTPRDLARVATVCMRGGEFEGRRLLPRDYLAAATSRQVDNRVGGTRANLGYGYKFWVMPHGSFACVGMGGQLALCVPSKDLVFITTADTQEHPGDSNILPPLFFEHLYPYIADQPVEPSPEDAEALAARIETLRIPAAEGRSDSPAARAVSGKEYRMDPNPMGITRFSFRFDEGEGEARWQNARGGQRLRFGLGKQARQVFTERYSGAQIGTPEGGYECLCSAAWTDDNSLMLYCYFIDNYLGVLKMAFSFGDGTMTVRMNKVAEWFLDDYVGFASGAEVDEAF